MTAYAQGKRYLFGLVPLLMRIGYKDDHVRPSGVINLIAEPALFWLGDQVI
ncbi:MAG: hypothetical protein ABL904_00505 [Hyphomicrobiaceae bacterium]